MSADDNLRSVPGFFGASGPVTLQPTLAEKAIHGELARLACATERVAAVLENLLVMVDRAVEADQRRR